MAATVRRQAIRGARSSTWALTRATSSRAAGEGWEGLWCLVMSPELLAPLLRFTVLLLAFLGVAAGAIQMMRRPARKRDRPMRRVLPWWLTAIALAFLLLGALLAVLGTMLLQAPDRTEDRSDGLGIAITGGAMVLFGVFFLWMRLIVYLESTPEGFASRGVLGRTVSIPYEELTGVQTTVQNGAARVTLTGQGGKRFTSAYAMVDWTYFERWRARCLEQQRLGEQRIDQ